MGTRNLTAVMLDGEYKIAQYGQWDGYPSGQGVTALDFMTKVDIDKFKEKVRSVRFITQEELEQIGNAHPNSWSRHYPHLSRDAGAEILQMVMGGASVLRNSIEFAGDSLMCEYAYVIDLDKNTFEVYSGFNKESVTDGRFVSDDVGLDKTDGYEPIIIMKSYDLLHLPNEVQFLFETETEE